MRMAALENVRYSWLAMSITGWTAFKKSCCLFLRWTFAASAQCSEQYLCEPLLQVNSFPQKAHFLVFLIWLLLCGFTINFLQTATEWTFVNHWHPLSTHSTMSRSSNEVTSLLLSLSFISQSLSTLVNLCQPSPRDGKIKALKILRGRNALLR